MNRLVAILGCCLVAHVALGGIIVSTPDAGWADAAWQSRGEAYRWGATARNMDSSSDTWELGIGNTPEMTQGGSSEASLDWGTPGSTHAFMLQYDAISGEAEWSMDGQTVLLQDPGALFSEMYIQLKTGAADSVISISNTTFNVGGSIVDIEDFTASGDRAHDVNGLQYIHVGSDGEPLSDLDFMLEGILFIDWSGQAPSNDSMGMHIKMTQIPEPASIIMIIFMSLSGLFIRRRFR